jgi:glyceraldehyde 3-phosphate dehydrogenase
MSTRLAINGFGRTGRQALKAIWRQHRPDLEIAAIGLLALEDAPAAAHLLRHDSNYGRFAQDVAVADGGLRIGDVIIPCVTAESLEDLPWRELGVEIVLEASGAYCSAEEAAGHLRAGAKKVVITDACEDADFTLIYGVNDHLYDPRRHHVVAADTETTNALAVVLRALSGAFDVQGALVTAVHAYTNAQKLIDTTDVDLRQARSAPVSIVPTTWRAAEATKLVLPEMAGRVDGYSVRVPVPVVSIIELIVKLGEPADAAGINAALKAAAAGPLGHVLAVSDEPLVSTDYRGCRYSAVIDAPLTIGIGPLAKLSAWYDNEWGYSNRVADVAALVAARQQGE